MKYKCCRELICVCNQTSLDCTSCHVFRHLHWNAIHICVDRYYMSCPAKDSHWPFHASNQALHFNWIDGSYLISPVASYCFVLRHWLYESWSNVSSNTFWRCYTPQYRNHCLASFCASVVHAASRPRFFDIVAVANNILLFTWFYIELHLKATPYLLVFFSFFKAFFF